MFNSKKSNQPFTMDNFINQLHRISTHLSYIYAPFKDIEFRQGTLTSMPFDSESMDKAISNCVINLEPEKQTVYNELYRILKNGGKFYISDIMLKKELPEEWKRSEKMHNT